MLHFVYELKERKIGIRENSDIALSLAVGGIFDVLESVETLLEARFSGMNLRSYGPIDIFSLNVAGIGLRFAKERGVIPFSVTAARLLMPRTYKERIDEAISIGLNDFAKRLRV